MTPEGIFLGADIGTWPHAPIQHTELGSLLWDGCGTEYSSFTFPMAGGVELALSDDILNQAAYSLWSAGSGNATFGDEELNWGMHAMGAADFTLTSAPMLPPILNSCPDGGAWTVQLGDLGLTGTVDWGGCVVDLTAYVSIEADAILEPTTVEGAPAVHVGLGTVNTLEVEIVSASGPNEGTSPPTRGTSSRRRCSPTCVATSRRSSTLSSFRCTTSRTSSRTTPAPTSSTSRRRCRWRPTSST